MQDRISRPSDILPVVLFLAIATIAGFFLLVDDEEVEAVSGVVQTPLDPDTIAPQSDVVVEPADSVATNVTENNPPIESREPNQLVFMDKAFTTLSRWQADDVRPLLAPTTNRAVNDEQLRYVLEVLQNKLGGLVSYDTPTAVRVTGTEEALAGATYESLDSYEFVAHYTEGDALVSLVLQKAREGYSLYHFDIEMKESTRPIAKLN